MSAEQIIAKIERLPQAEQEAVLAFLEKRLGDAGTAGESVSPSFRKLAGEVFTENAELFRKLAQ
jgi:hypothetical protein